MLHGIGVDTSQTEEVAKGLEDLTLNATTPATIKASVDIIASIAEVHDKYPDVPPSAEEVQVMSIFVNPYRKNCQSLRGLCAEG